MKSKQVSRRVKRRSNIGCGKVENSTKCQLNEMYEQVKTLNRSRNTVERPVKAKNHEDNEKKTNLKCFACCGNRMENPNMDGILNCNGKCNGFFHAGCLIDHGFSELELKNHWKHKNFICTQCENMEKNFSNDTCFGNTKK